MRTSPPVKVKVYYPQAKAGQQALLQRAAEAHAEFVTLYIKNMSCPTWQKLVLIDAIIKATKDQ